MGRRELQIASWAVALTGLGQCHVAMISCKGSAVFEQAPEEGKGCLLSTQHIALSTWFQQLKAYQCHHYHSSVFFSAPERRMCNHQRSCMIGKALRIDHNDGKHESRENHESRL